MASIVVAGDTSGTVTLAAPAVSGTTTLTLPTANGTLVTTASGQTLTSPTIATPTITGQATIPTINLTGGQITFPATQNPSSDANTLDDYEEGSWTPTILFGGASVGITYAAQQASYIKIGKNIFVQFRVSLSNKGSSTGNANIGGLPFAASGSVASNGYPAGTFTFDNGGVSLPYGLFCLAWSDSTLYLRANNGGTAFTSVSNSNFNTSCDVWGSITYQT
jgi:hypothetical protein